jgi:hypothetical protein
VGDLFVQLVADLVEAFVEWWLLFSKRAQRILLRRWWRLPSARPGARVTELVVQLGAGIGEWWLTLRKRVERFLLRR